MGRRATRNCVIVAAVAGSVHGVCSIYWGLGGDALLSTLGSVATEFEDVRWPLLVIGVATMGFALLPLLVGQALTRPRSLRVIWWTGGVVLTAWGAINSISAILLLARVIPRPDDFDLVGTVGHAFLWDPLFLIWGAALCAALVSTRSGVTR